MAARARRRCIVRIGAALALVACGSPGPSPSERAAQEVASISPEPALRPVCGDPHEAAIRALAGELPPCARGVHSAYVVARDRRGSVLVAASIDRRPSAADRPAVRQVVTRIDGRAVEGEPALAPRAQADAAPLLVAAVLARHGDPRLALDPDGFASLVPEPWRERIDGLVLGASGDRVTAAGTRDVDAGSTIVTRYDATLDARGGVEVEARVIATRGAHGTTLPGLRAAVAPLPRTEQPRPVCGDPHEATVRVLAGDLPRCDRFVDATYVAARTRVGELLVVAWSDAREAAVDGPMLREVRIVLSDALMNGIPGVLAPESDADRAPILFAAVLAAHGSPDVTLDPAALPEPLASRVPLEGAPLGMSTTESRAELRVLGWRSDASLGGGSSEVTRWEATLADDGTLQTTSATILSLGRARAPRQPRAGDDPLAGLEGL